MDRDRGGDDNNGPIKLPPMLSPTLPQWAEEQLCPPNRMLSPTLPEQYERYLKSDDSEDLPALSSKLNRAVGGVGGGSGLVSVEKNRKRPSLVISIKLGSSLRKIVKKELSSQTIQDKPNASSNKSPSKLALTNGNGDAISKSSVLKRRSIVQEAPKNKKTRVSRSYSSSDSESDVSLASRKKTATPSTVHASASASRVSTATKSMAINVTKAESLRGSTPTVMTPKDSKVVREPKASAVAGEKREKFYRLLRGKMHNWIDIAREKKHEGDAAGEKNMRDLAQVISLDSLFAFVVGFDYEDRGEIMMKRDPSATSWLTLVPYIGRMIKLFELQKNSDFIGAAYQMRALIHLRIASCYHAELQRHIRNSNDSAIKTVTSKYMASNDAAMADFKKGYEELNLDTIREKYPATWNRRSKAPQPASRREGGYRPLDDPYWLPLHMFSSMQEATAFTYSLTKEWADNNGVECDWALIKGLR